MSPHCGRRVWSQPDLALRGFLPGRADALAGAVPRRVRVTPFPLAACLRLDLAPAAAAVLWAASQVEAVAVGGFFLFPSSAAAAVLPLPALAVARHRFVPASDLDVALSLDARLLTAHGVRD